mmetsp:Transcript_13003/g.28231  ORF Transcript_13003/g.28231 Transcript_13003/m.28231 type:complete len:245 (-) Transcript_13003:2647-3381(-)
MMRMRRSAQPPWKSTPAASTVRTASRSLRWRILMAVSLAALSSSLPTFLASIVLPVMDSSRSSRMRVNLCRSFQIFLMPWDPKLVEMPLLAVPSMFFRLVHCPVRPVLKTSRVPLMPTRTSSTCSESAPSPSSLPRARRIPATTPSLIAMDSKRIPSDAECALPSTTSLSSDVSLTTMPSSAFLLLAVMFKSTLVPRRLRDAMPPRWCLFVELPTLPALPPFPERVAPSSKVLMNWNVRSPTRR